MESSANGSAEHLKSSHHPTPGPEVPAEWVLDTLPWAVWVLDEQRLIRRVNQQAARWCGAAPGALLGRPLPADVAAAPVLHALHQLLAAGEGTTREVQLPGTEHWLMLTCTHLPDDGWTIYGQDITPQKQREQQYQTLAENTPDVLTRWTPDLRLRYANAAFAAKVGQPLVELLGRTFAEMPVPAEVTGSYMEALQHVFDTGRPQEHFNTFPTPHGEVQYYSRLVPERRDGEIATVLGIGRDITALKQQEAVTLQLREELAQRTADHYHALFHRMDQGFCVLELLFDDAGQQVVDFTYQQLNPVFFQQSGIPEDVLGKRSRAVMPDLEPFWFETYGRVALTGESERVEHYVPQVDRWFNVHTFRIGAPEARQVGVLFHDVTARKQQEQQQAFLLRFSDALRAETNATSVAYQALGMLGEQLQLDRCYIGLYHLAEDRATFPHQVGNDRIPPLPAEVRLSDFPDALRVAYDRTLRIDDLAQTAGLSDTDRHNLGALGLRALVAATLRRGGDGPQWAIVALAADVRHWTPEEVALLEEATERTWAAMERARTDEALRESEARFRAVANLVPDLLWRSTPDSDTTWYNQRWYEYTGQTLAEAAGYGWTDAIHPDDRAASCHRYHTAVVSGQPLLQEHRIRSAQGEYRWFQVQARPLLNEHGTVAAWYGAATDMHARQLAEDDLRHAEESHRAELEQQVAERTRQLRESRHLLQTVFDASPTAIVVMRLLRDGAGQVEDFEILIYNEFNKQVTGRDDLAGQRFSALFPQTVPTGTLARLLDVATTGEPADFEQWYEGEGIQHWFRHIIVRQEGLLVLTSEVITARKQAEQGRARNLHLLEQAEAVAGLGSWDYDLHTGEFLWSEGMYRLFDLPPGQPMSPDVYLQYVVDEDRSLAEQLVRCLTTGNDCFEQTLRLRVGEQVKTVRIKSVVLPDEAGQPARVLGVDLDVSQLQRLEADNLRLHLTQQQALFEAVQAAQEIERKRMAESLHNGIGQMLCATKLRLDRLHAPVLHTLPAVVAARNETDQLLNEAIRQTRVLSHELVSMVLEEFGLEAALKDIGSNMSTPTLRFRCHMQLDQDAAPLTTVLQMALYRMAQELAQNIVKHARGATEASLELETMPGWVLLRAEDNGAGFAPAPVGRSGLGLRSIRDRVALLGGQVNLGAASAGGAYVRIRIPLPDSPSL